MGSILSAPKPSRLRKLSSERTRAITPHAALFTDEVLRHVFTVSEAARDRTYRATCARAARVCRAWYAPASSAIWETRPWHLFDLLHILLPDPPPLDASGFASEYRLQQYLRSVSPHLNF